MVSTDRFEEEWFSDGNQFVKILKRQNIHLNAAVNRKVGVEQVQWDGAVGFGVECHPHSRRHRRGKASARFSSILPCGQLPFQSPRGFFGRH